MWKVFLWCLRGLEIAAEVGCDSSKSIMKQTSTPGQAMGRLTLPMHVILRAGVDCSSGQRPVVMMFAAQWHSSLSMEWKEHICFGCSSDRQQIKRLHTQWINYKLIRKSPGASSSPSSDSRFHCHYYSSRWHVGFHVAVLVPTRESSSTHSYTSLNLCYHTSQCGFVQSNERDSIFTTPSEKYGGNLTQW